MNFLEIKLNFLVFDCQLQFFMLPTNLGIRCLMMQFLIKFNRYTSESCPKFSRLNTQ